MASCGKNMTSSRKAAIQAFKERKTPRGIFAVRCRATGTVWVDSAMDLDAAENRTWFVLRNGDAQIDKSIAVEFQTHGREAFTYEILEKLDDDVMPLAIRDLLRERKLHWLAQLGARKLSPV
jgi:hypothetical protein